MLNQVGNINKVQNDWKIRTFLLDLCGLYKIENRLDKIESNCRHYENLFSMTQSPNEMLGNKIAKKRLQSLKSRLEKRQAMYQSILGAYFQDASITPMNMLRVFSAPMVQKYFDSKISAVNKEINMLELKEKADEIVADNSNLIKLINADIKKLRNNKKNTKICHSLIIVSIKALYPECKIEKDNISKIIDILLRNNTDVEVATALTCFKNNLDEMKIKAADITIKLKKLKHELENETNLVRIMLEPDYFKISMLARKLGFTTAQNFELLQWLEDTGSQASFSFSQKNCLKNILTNAFHDAVNNITVTENTKNRLKSRMCYAVFRVSSSAYEKELVGNTTLQNSITSLAKIFEVDKPLLHLLQQDNVNKLHAVENMQAMANNISALYLNIIKNENISQNEQRLPVKNEELSANELNKVYPQQTLDREIANVAWIL